MKYNSVHEGDAYEVMKLIPSNSMNMVLTDPPYSITRNEWDVEINLDNFWEECKRILSPSGCVVLTASQPFSSKVVVSNFSWFRYEWIWNKRMVTGVLNAKHRPLKSHESILVFAPSKFTYNPQGLKNFNRIRSQGKSSSNYAKRNELPYLQKFTNFPRSIIEIGYTKKDRGMHPTQKPLALFEYLVATYSNIGDLILDPFAGSGTSAIACKNLSRKFILIEKNKIYSKIIMNRLNEEKGNFK